jgi:hypothetical protein
MNNDLPSYPDHTPFLVSYQYALAVHPGKTPYVLQLDLGKVFRLAGTKSV